MKTPVNHATPFQKGAVVALAASLLLCFCAVDALAQRGNQLDPAKREAAWSLQAKGVAKSIGLSDELTTKLADAYVASHKSLQEAIEKLMASGESGAARFQAYRKATDEERDKFKAAISGFLTPEQVDKAIAPLGTFSRSWDRMVDTLSEFKLEGDKQDKALDLIAKYVVDADKVMRDAMDRQDWDSLRSKTQELKGTLDTALGDVLSEAQLADWKEATTFRGGGGGGGGQRGGGGGGQGGNG